MGMASVPILVDGDVLGSLGIVVATGRIRDEEYQETPLQILREMVNTVAINYQYGN